MNKDDHKEDYKFIMLNLGVQIRNPLSTAHLEFNEPSLRKRIAYQVNNPYWIKAYIFYVLNSILLFVAITGPTTIILGLLVWSSTFHRVSELSMLAGGYAAAQATILFTMIVWDMYERIPSTKKVLTKYKYKDE